MRWEATRDESRRRRSRARGSYCPSFVGHPSKIGKAARTGHLVYALLTMVIGQRLRELRESKKLSQGDVEKRTGLLRCYTSRVENGHTIPSLETLEKYAGALELPIYRFFYEGDKPPDKSKLLTHSDGPEWGAKGQERNELRAFTKALSRLNDKQWQLLLATATHMAYGKRK